MIIGDDAVSAMYEYICNNLSKIGVKKGNVFKYKRPKKLDSDSYIVINHLPFVHESEIENGMINVNVHVQRTASDEPNTKKLTTQAKAILALFGNSTYLGGAYFDSYSDSLPTEDDDNTYYINLKFKVTYNNLKN